MARRSCQGPSTGWPRGEEQRRATPPLWGCAGVACPCLQVWDSMEKSQGDLLTFFKLELTLIRPALESLNKVVKNKRERSCFNLRCRLLFSVLGKG